MSAPHHALGHWKEIAGELRRARHVALFTDFDGTLVRIGRHPDQVILPARVRELLGSIARSGVTVGIVSGRKVVDVRKRVCLRGIWYVGAHGFFLLDPGNRSIALVSPKQRKLMQRVGRTLTRRLRGVAGLRLEPKKATFAVHYRGAPPRSKQLARRVVFEMIERFSGMSLLSGKRVWGLLPDSHSDKWTAISYILHRERKRASKGRWLIIFLGDDATDERVFAKMKGTSIAVGRKRRTAARYYLGSPTEVRGFLAQLKKAMK